MEDERLSDQILTSEDHMDLQHKQIPFQRTVAVNKDPDKSATDDEDVGMEQDTKISDLQAEQTRTNEPMEQMKTTIEVIAKNAAELTRLAAESQESENRLREELRVEKERVNKLKKELEKEKKELKKEKEELDKGKKELEKEKKELEEEKKELEKEKKELEEKKKELEKEQKDLEEEKTRIDEEKTQIDEQKTQVDEQKKELHLERSRNTEMVKRDTSADRWIAKLRELRRRNAALEFQNGAQDAQILRLTRQLQNAVRPIFRIKLGKHIKELRCDNDALWLLGIMEEQAEALNEYHNAKGHWDWGMKGRIERAGIDLRARIVRLYR